MRRRGLEGPDDVFRTRTGDGPKRKVWVVSHGYGGTSPVSGRRVKHWEGDPDVDPAPGGKTGNDEGPVRGRYDDLWGRPHAGRVTDRVEVRSPDRT